MTRYTQLALMLCVAVAGTAVEARADCHKVRGSIAETSIPSNDQFGRLLGTVTGVLNGASATGTMTFDGRTHTGTVPTTVDLVYQGTVCGPNVKGGGN
jgi:hypothetical protein